MQGVDAAVHRQLLARLPSSLYSGAGAYVEHLANGIQLHQPAAPRCKLAKLLVMLQTPLSEFVRSSHESCECGKQQAQGQRSVC